jgi:hypothetical protein
MGMVTSSVTSDDESDISTPGEANTVKNEAKVHHQHSNDTNRPAEPNGGLQHLNDDHRSSGPESGVNHLSLRIGKLDITERIDGILRPHAVAIVCSHDVLHS